MQEQLSTIAGIVVILAHVPYVVAILRRTAKPTKATWLIWALNDSLAVGSMYYAGALNGQIVGACIGAWIVAVLSLWRGKPGWNYVDAICFAGAIIGMIGWMLTSQAIIGIVLSQIVGFVGTVPTFVSAYENPKNENRTTWTMFFISCVLTIAAIPAWTIANAAQPINFTVGTTIIMYLLWIRPVMRR